MNIKAHLCVEIEAEAWECIRQWTQFADGEFSCLGTVGDDLYINEVHLLEQECTDTATELDPEAVATLLMGLDRPEHARAWIHSHSDMQCFWSNTDEDCIEGLANESFLISIVVNKAGDYRCRVDLFRPVRLTIDKVPVVVRVRSPRLAAACKREFDQKVREVPVQLMIGQPFQHRTLSPDSQELTGFNDWLRVRGGSR